jgi:transcriptional regulator with XRE-family HTH domain
MKVKSERIKRGWTQEKLAALTDIAATDLCAVENGHRPFYPRWRNRVAQVMGISPTAFDEE